MQESRLLGASTGAQLLNILQIMTFVTVFKAGEVV